jgi:tRNA pseudouridine55 synthase
MARKRHGDRLHGWLVIDKGLNVTSAKAVSKAQNILNAAKVGHSGTLDPLATGVLPLAFGEATKTISYLMDAKKEYSFTVCWGEARDTDDTEGVVTARNSVRPTEADIEAALPNFIGNIQQVPPIYSAVKVEGERAYKLARENKFFELKPRSILIDQFKLIDMPDQDHASFEVTSGKGAYIRGLARDIARHMGAFGHVSKLRRTRVGPFCESNAILLDHLETEDEARRLRCGQSISALQVAKRIPLTEIDQGAIICAMASGKVVALAKLKGIEICPFRVLNF